MTIKWTIPGRNPNLSYLPGYHDGWLMAWGVSHKILETLKRVPWMTNCDLLQGLQEEKILYFV
jgi:hypothetical protein